MKIPIDFHLVPIGHIKESNREQKTENLIHKIYLVGNVVVCVSHT